MTDKVQKYDQLCHSFLLNEITDLIEEADSDFELDPLDATSERSWEPPQGTRDALNKYLRTGLDKETRTKCVERFPSPSVLVAKVPVIDKAMNQILAQKRIGIRNIPGALAMEGIQGRMLDAIGPLSSIHAAALDAKSAGKGMNPNAVLEALNHSLVLLGNANAQITYQRQRAIMQKVNPAAVMYLDKDKHPVDTNELFGATIRKSIKEAVDMKKDFGVAAPTFDRNKSRPSRPQSSFGRSFRYQPYNGKKDNNRPSYRHQAPSQHQHQAPVFYQKNKKGEQENRLNFDFWTTITDDPWVLGCIKGYQLPFESLPSRYLNPPLHIVKDNEEIINTEIISLQSKNAVEICEHAYFLNQIFLVPKKDGISWRPILNLKPLNRYLKSFHFKMESINMVTDLLQKGMWLCKIDFKDAYFSVPIAVQDRKFLQFKWKSKIFQYKCLPFGLSTAPYVFTKLTKPLVSLLREVGIKLIIFLDDILVMGDSDRDTKGSCDQALLLFTNAGFTINSERSIVTPTQQIDFLGFHIDSQAMTYSLPIEKQNNISDSAKHLLQTLQTVTPRKLSKFIGKVIAARLALRTSNLKLRALQMNLIHCLREKKNWDAHLSLHQEALDDLKWWASIKTFPSSPIVFEHPNLEIESDSSLEAWGATSAGVKTGGRWSKKDLQLYQHINQLELVAAFLALKSFWKPPCSSVLLRLDNQTAVAYINKIGGTRSLKLNNIALEIWEWCVQNSVWIKAEYLPGVLNTIADWESRNQSDSSSWMLAPQLFAKLHQKFQFQVDLFAERTNAQLPTYWSWKPDPEAQVTDAFTASWRGIQAYAFPPFCLIGMSIKKCLEDQATIVLIAPVWQNQHWYPALLTSLYQAPILIPQNADLLTDAVGQLHPLVVQQRLQLAAWPISGEMVKTQEFQRKLPVSFQTQYVQNLRKHTTQPGNRFKAGVIRGKLISFLHLNPK